MGLVVSPESIVIENAPVALPTGHTPAVTDWRMIMWDGESTTVGAYTGALINDTAIQQFDFCRRPII